MTAEVCSRLSSMGMLSSLVSSSLSRWMAVVVTSKLVGPSRSMVFGSGPSEPANYRLVLDAALSQQASHDVSSPKPAISPAASAITIVRCSKGSSS